MAILNKREKLLMDPAWRFFKGDFPFPVGHGGWTKGSNFSLPPIEPLFDDSTWRLVDLPHDFVVEGRFRRALDVSREAHNVAGMVSGQTLYAMHGSLPAGVGWYRKQFFLPRADSGRRLSLEFDGVARNATVWLNKHYLGQHLSGYTPFRYDIADIAVYGGVNTLTVRVDAREYEGWFYEGGGIYRHVWLIKHHPVHVAPDGVFVRSDLVSRNGNTRAKVTVRTTILNSGEQDQSCRLVTRIVGAAGRGVGEDGKRRRLQPGEQAEITQVFTLASPELWSVEKPIRYALKSALMAGNEEIDSCQTRFGIRTIRFDSQHGFFLNGQPLKLKGVCCHQDHAGVGVALPDRVQEFRLRQLKEMGCNAYRCSHNPPTPELLDACDRLGLLVMDENRLLSCSPEYLGQLETLIKRDRNHPSVILWSLANEEVTLQSTEAGARIAATMKRVVRRLDPSRPVTVAMNGGWGKPVSQVVDVQGCNYIRIGDVDKFHERFPNQPVLFSESGSTVGTRGVYANDKKRGYVTAYDASQVSWGDTAEDNWLFCVQRPFLAGTFVWTGFDYRGEPTPYAWPCISSHFGILDTCGFPKDNFYYYQSWWSDQTVLHVFPHWNWPQRAGQPVNVWVHSNCDQVELFLNGRSLGRQEVEPCRHLEWQVRYVPGVLLAKGWRNGKLSAVSRVETTGAPAGVKLLTGRAPLNADGEDVALVTAAVVDDRGRVVPVAQDEISFSVSPNARIIGVGNGDPSSHEPDKASQRRAFHGLCQVIIQAGRRAGVIRLKAHAPGLREGSLTIKARHCDPRPAVASVTASQIERRLLRFECATLRRGTRDIRRAALPRGLAYRAATAGQDGFCDVRRFHEGKDGLVFIRTVLNARQAGAGLLTYGADGPVKVWVNGDAVDCQTDGTNPAVEAGYRAPVRWRKGRNAIVFGLATNGGQAWGIYAGAIVTPLRGGSSSGSTVKPGESMRE